MGRLRKGCVISRDGSVYARVQWTDDNGKRRQKEKKAENKSHADRLIKQMLREIDDYGPHSLDSETMTFADLADYYQENNLIPAEYADGRKVAGLRSLNSAITRWGILRDYFGKKRLRSITYGDLMRFRSRRLNTPTIHGRPRSITTVNRELETLRAMMNVAYREGWILKNPFNSGPSLIQKAHERKRERILTKDEESRLLAACLDRRSHLKPIIIMALDTGMRRGEILSLCWEDIDLENGHIRIKAFHTKTQQERTLIMTPRLKLELLIMYQARPHDQKDRIFGILDNVRKSFKYACHVVDITNMRFHDLRHTYATRLIRGGVSQAEVSRSLGHNNTKTTDRYINNDLETARRIAERLSTYNEVTSKEAIDGAV